jgi:hypothetical protein
MIENSTFLQISHSFNQFECQWLFQVVDGEFPHGIHILSYK